MSDAIEPGDVITGSTRGRPMTIGSTEDETTDSIARPRPDQGGGGIFRDRAWRNSGAGVPPSCWNARTSPQAPAKSPAL